MDVDLDILEVSVPENEFDADAGFEESSLDYDACGKDQEMEAAEDNISLWVKETFADDKAKCDKQQKGLRDTITGSRIDSENLPSEEEKDGLSSNHKRKNSSKSRRRHGNDKSIGGSRLFKPLDASSDLDPRILGREIAYRLGETKVGLIINVVKVLGFNCAMEILRDTKKIENKGGILTADKSRRRSPGGVYIYCLKERGYATKKEIDRIFKDEKERLKEKIKQKRHKQTAKRREEAEKLAKLKKRVIDYVNKKIEGGTEKESDDFSDGEIDAANEAGEKMATGDVESENILAKEIS